MSDIDILNIDCLGIFWWGGGELTNVECVKPIHSLGKKVNFWCGKQKSAYDLKVNFEMNCFKPQGNVSSAFYI